MAKRQTYEQAYQGPSTWYIPSGEDTSTTGLPEGLLPEDLTVDEIKAAIDLRVIAPFAVDLDTFNAAQEVTSRRAAIGAKSLLKKLGINRSE